MKPRARLLLADKIFALVLFVTVGGSINQTLAATPAEYSVETLVRGLDTPWAIDFAPDGRIFISERPGRIRVVERGQLRAEPWMNIDVASAGEAGLLGSQVSDQLPHH